MSKKPTTITFPLAAKVRENTLSSANKAREEEIDKLKRRVVSAICEAAGRGDFSAHLHSCPGWAIESRAAVEAVAAELRANGFRVKTPVGGGTQMVISWEQP